MKILDLFCGMGGLSLGFALALRGTEILGLDIDKYAVDTYNLNLERFNAKAELQDVLEWIPNKEYDVVVGGSPCQPFSIANIKKRGKEHTLYPTFPQFFEIVLEVRPRAFLLENVKGLVTKTHRHLLEEQLNRVSEFYKVKYAVLNSADYGVPQKRERLLVLGVRNDLDVIPSFPTQTHAENETITLDGKRILRWVTVREAIGDLLKIPPQNYPKKLVQTNPNHGKLLDMDKPSRTVKVDGRGGDFCFDTMLVPVSDHEVSNVKIGKTHPLVELPSEHVMTEKGGWTNEKSKWGSRIMKVDKPAYTITEKHRSGQLVELPNEIDPSKLSVEEIESILGYKIKYKDRIPINFGEPSRTITTNIARNVQKPNKPVYIDGKVRRLTVRECLRLQSFPDWWSFPNYVSISRMYKLVGEAVPPVLAYRLAEHLGRLLGFDVKEPTREDFDLPYFERVFGDESRN